MVSYYNYNKFDIIFKKFESILAIKEIKSILQALKQKDQNSLIMIIKNHIKNEITEAEG